MFSVSHTSLRSITSIICFCGRVSSVTVNRVADLSRSIWLLRTFHQIRHRQVVAVGLSVLVISDGVHTNGIRNLPGLFGQSFDDLKRLEGEDIFILRLENEENILGTGIGILEFLKGDKLGIVF